jgi:hypothetical protein
MIQAQLKVKILYKFNFSTLLAKKLDISISSVVQTLAPSVNEICMVNKWGNMTIP